MHLKQDKKSLTNHIYKKMKKQSFPLLRKAIKKGVHEGLSRIDDMDITNEDAIIIEIVEAIIEQIEEQYNFEHE